MHYHRLYFFPYIMKRKNIKWQKKSYKYLLATQEETLCYTDEVAERSGKKCLYMMVELTNRIGKNSENFSSIISSKKRKKTL